MKKEVIKILFTVLFILTLFLSSAKTKTIEAQAYQVVDVKCNNCTTTYSACGNYFGRTNVKRRSCTGAVNGAQTCTVASGTVQNPTFWQVVTCTAGGTPTPTPTLFNCTCTGAYGTCGNFSGHSNSKRRACTLSTTTTTTKCEKVGTIYYNYAVCAATPTPTGTVPTPTINLACVCNANGLCSSPDCQFSKYLATELPPNVTYSNPIKCGVAATFFQTTPTAANKNDWCRRPQKTKGDADGNDKVNLLDYFYYVQAKSGGKIPAKINPDFNGDNAINNEDRVIILKTL